MQETKKKYTFISIHGNPEEVELLNNVADRKYTLNKDSRENCAYCYENHNENKFYYFVKYNLGQLFDIQRKNDRGYITQGWKWKKVSKQVFDLYVEYVLLSNLKKSNVRLLKRAESLIN